MQGNTVDVPFFLAIAEGDQILTKKIYTARIVFPPNVDQVTLDQRSDPHGLPGQPDQIRCRLHRAGRIPAHRTELAVNRQHAAGRP